MKVTYTQIENALNNSPSDIAEDKYEAIRACENEAVIKISTKVKKTSNYFSKADWKKVYTEIKKMLA